MHEFPGIRYGGIGYGGTLAYGDAGSIGFGGDDGAAPASVLKVVHITTLNYPVPIIASYNEARMRPINDERQFVRRFKLDLKPVTYQDEYYDYWGTAVTAFEVLTSHKRLRIVADAIVEIHQDPTLATTGVSWEELASDQVLDAFSEMLTPTPTTAVCDHVVEIAQAAAAGLEPIAAAEAVCVALRDQLEYVPGATTVHTSALEAWEAKRGVCQDMAHLCIGALRALGIPARYVSGYLHPKLEAGIGEKVKGDSHAWLEFWAGEWVGYDPTNRKFVTTDHIVVARGREYADVPPLKGVYAGAPESALSVTVEMTRLA